MRKQRPVWWKLAKVSAVVAGGGLLIAGCGGPVKMGAAAIVGSQRITVATLDTEVTNLSQAAKKYPGIVNLNQAQQTQETLSWLVRFQINEELARQAGITVSAAEAEQALNQIYASAKASAAAQGLSNVSLELVMAANGIPPNLSAELGRYQAIEDKFVEQGNGGKLPTSTAAQNAATARLQHAQCLAAKALSIQVNPQFGRLDYANQYQVVSAPSKVSASAGPAPTASPSGTAPAC